MDISGVLMPKEPKITQMDWRSLGYWPVYKNGKKVWVPKDDTNNKDRED
jgi:hypothetical protein